MQRESRSASKIAAGVLPLVLTALLPGLAIGQIVRPPKQPPVPPDATPDTTAGFSSVRIIENADMRRVISLGRDCIKDRDWKTAIKHLQSVLNEKKDSCIKVEETDPSGKASILRWVSSKFEANNLIGSMPAEGLGEYESAHGAEARKLLDEARKKDDHVLYAELALRFRHTRAGAEANKVLSASKALDVGKQRDWPSWRGNATNTAQASGSPPVLKTVLFRRPIFMDKLEGFGGEDPDQESLKRVNDAVAQMEKLNLPVLPGFFPIAADGVMVYRSQRDVRAIALKDIDIPEDGQIIKIKRGERLWTTLLLDRSLAYLLDNARTRAKTNDWIRSFGAVQGYNSFLYDNTLIGTVSTDHRLVYLINDMAVPPIPNTFMAFQWNNPQFNPGDLKRPLMSNELHALDLISGKRVWDINEDMPQFKDSHFLSVPISVGGKLYVLNEKVTNLNEKVGGKPDQPDQFGGESELRLICIDPTKVVDGKPHIVEPIQVLGTVLQHDRFVQDPRRRVNAAALAYSEGMLVCPTNAGEVFGIDLMTRSLVWSYPYRESQLAPVQLPNQPNNPFVPQPLPQPPVQPGPEAPTISRWKSSPPAIQDGKVVFTAPDADSVHCINLRDGKRLWKKGREKGDLYFAGVFEGRVLIVGDKLLRALDLKDGSQLWSIALGDSPSGQGAAIKMIYHLPVKTGILAVDLVKGEIKTRHPVAAGESSPGNLIFYENMVLSQTITEVRAYPQLDAPPR